MKYNSIKWRIFKYNLIVVISMFTVVIIIFNAAIRLYIQKEILGQLRVIATHTEEKALVHGPDYFPRHNGDNIDNFNKFPPPRKMDNKNDDLFHYYFILDQSLRESLSVLNADYLLFDNKLKRINPTPNENNPQSNIIVNRINSELIKTKNNISEHYFNFSLSGNNYVAIIKPVAQKNSFGLGWIIIYSSLQKVDQLKLVINFMLFVIMFISSAVIVFFSSITAKRISSPLSSVNTHIKELTQRNFSSLDKIPKDDELLNLVNNINIMSAKLSEYDKAQKTFLQNASHEFRTPLMSIQSYAEGIKYEVVDPISSSEIILSEAKRMTSLVEDLLYLSRLDTIQESYSYDFVPINELIYICYDRMNGIAMTKGIKLVKNLPNEENLILADEEKLSRAITNILSNCIRYAKTSVTLRLNSNGSQSIKLCIYDDGSGFEPSELPNVFDRFYKGKNGNFGLGLTISQNIIEKHGGTISAENTDTGALFIIILPLNN